MPLATTKEMMEAARAGGYAVGAFNILNELSARAVVKRCEALRAPVILQTSVGTVKQIGVKSIIGFLRAIGQNAGVPVAIHLDHCKDLALAKACVDAGWTSVMVDASHCPLEENIAQTKEITGYAKGKNVSVEGELGAIGGVEDDIVVKEGDERLASVADSVTYTRETGIDVFAPAIGTAHGLYKGVPKLDFDRFVEIRDVVPQPLVVHGGTGLADDVFRKLVGLGAAKINISTALKHAYLDGVKEFVQQYPDEGNPLKLDAFVEGRIGDMAERHVLLFGTDGRA